MIKTSVPNVWDFRRLNYVYHAMLMVMMMVMLVMLMMIMVVLVMMMMMMLVVLVDINEQVRITSKWSVLPQALRPVFPRRTLIRGGNNMMICSKISPKCLLKF